MANGQMEMQKVIAQALGVKFKDPKKTIHIDDLSSDDLVNLGINVRR